jgi:hypothetical protein
VEIIVVMIPKKVSAKMLVNNHSSIKKKILLKMKKKIKQTKDKNVMCAKKIISVKFKK